MRFLILFILSFFSSYSIFAACSDQPANEVDWTNCNFVENLDLSGTGLANSQMSGVNFCLLYTSPSPRDMRRTRMPSSA